MKKLLYIITAVILLTSLSAMVVLPVSAATELLPDPGFENLSSNGWWPAENWNCYTTVPTQTNYIEQDPLKIRNGKYSCIFTNIVAGRTSFAQHIVNDIKNMDASTLYKFSGWVMTDNVVERKGYTGGAFLEISYRKNGATGKVLLEQQTLENNGGIKGTNKWMQISVNVNLNDGLVLGADTVVISAGFKNATGSAWFDDMSLVKLDTPSNGTSSSGNTSSKTNSNASSTSISGKTESDPTSSVSQSTSVPSSEPVDPEDYAKTIQEAVSALNNVDIDYDQKTITLSSPTTVTQFLTCIKIGSGVDVKLMDDKGSEAVPSLVIHSGFKLVLTGAQSAIFNIIVTGESSSSNDRGGNYISVIDWGITGIIIGIVAVILIAGGIVLFIFLKKKRNN